MHPHIDPLPNTHSPDTRRQAGGGVLEFAIGAVPVLLMGFGLLETIHWFSTRTVLQQALMEAARAGSTEHTDPYAMEKAFTQALTPLFPATARATSLQRQQQAHQEIRDTLGRPAWVITQQSPDSTMFAQHHDRALQRQQGYPERVINNEYVAEQMAKTHSALPEPGSSIREATTLRLQLHYAVQPMVTGISQMMKLFGERNGNYTAHALSHGYLPMDLSLTVTMQSHPVQWPLPLNGHIQRQGETTAFNTAAQSTAQSSCTGLWCYKADKSILQAHEYTNGIPRPPAKPIESVSSAPSHTTMPHNDAAGDMVIHNTEMNTPTTPHTGTHTLPTDDAACGVIVCCF